MKRSFNTTDAWYEKSLIELKGKTFPETNMKRLYTSLDLEKLELEETLPGFFPFTRGTKATMYTGRPWTIRQYSGFSTAKESNEFYRKNLKAGQKGLSIAFDLPTHRGYDSDDENIVGDVGKAGVAIDTVEDMKILFDSIPLDKVSVSMTMNGAVLPIMAAYIVAAQEQGVNQEELTGTIQNDILKEFMVRNTYIYPPGVSMRIVGDVMEYINNNMPKYNSISISGYHMQEAGATIVQELAFTLGNGLEYVKEALNRGMKIDDFAPRLSFFFGTGMNFFMEIAKLRAARVIWANLMKQFDPQKQESMILRTHCQTSGWSLTQQDPYNNIVRTTVEAMASIFGGTQSLHTNSFDEALGLPTEMSARVARNTQLILQEETGITDVIDPFAGSYLVESLTASLVNETTKILDEITEAGGMLKSVETGSPKQLIEEASVRRQALIDQGDEVIVGVNKYQLNDEHKIDVREVDNTIVRDEQIVRLNSIKQNREIVKISSILDLITQATKNGKGNLLELSVEAMKLRATVGEVSTAIERAAGRYSAPINTSDGIYKENFRNKENLNNLSKQIEVLSTIMSSKPKILLSKIGQDGHDRGIKVVATAYKDFGFDVVVAPLFQTPQEVVDKAIKENAHIIGISTLAGGHKTLVAKVMKILKNNNKKDIIVVIGGVVPPCDYNFLKEMGVSAIFPPGTTLLDSANKIINLFKEHIDNYNIRINTGE